LLRFIGPMSSRYDKSDSASLLKNSPAIFS
jgi:hypothetical protein